MNTSHLHPARFAPGSGDVLFLSLEDVLACGGGDVVLASEDVHQGFDLLRRGLIQQPSKVSLQPSPEQPDCETGYVNFMPTFIERDGRQVLGCKAMGSMPTNVGRGLPRAAGLILLFDPATKLPACVMDSQVISATRTGAVSLLAARRLASSATREVGLVGAGVNMRTQLLGLRASLPALQRCRVYARGESRHRFAAEMSARTGLEVRAVDSAEEAVRDQELVVTCVSVDHAPVVRERWVRERGLTVFSISGFEVELELLGRMDRIIADRWKDVRSRGVQAHAIAVARGLLAESRVEDLGPILAGEVPGRRSETENIFFSPVGLAFEDILVADRVFRTALARGLGQRLPLWESSQWV
ncbi:ornithine cyclodeaminase family protein [Pyxidicoccus fallax]|uniref:Ornithine cyclodeaminase family protein n=3 Tax=Pyxidicoccus fallax TaxID=394095 RepID=A0A848LWA0_9BACT|nr:ornithine cyclodeaminase family protein [Pyxidicoccus fallax]NMO21911.1 ornithine cyclodeaminase family protein [Pyxidicoccus fallax]